MMIYDIHFHESVVKKECLTGEQKQALLQLRKMLATNAGKIDQNLTTIF